RLEARGLAVPHEARLEPGAMAARDGPKTTVVPARVLEGKPKTHQAFGLGVEKGRVLVAPHLAADEGRLEDVHRLDEARPVDAELGDQRLEGGGARERVEGGV